MRGPATGTDPASEPSSANGTPVAGPGDVSRETVPWVLTAVYVAALAVFCALERRTLFSWPDGIVTGNLLASAIWAPLAVVHLDRLARRHHRERAAADDKRHREHLELLRRHHAEVLEVVNAPDCPRCVCTCGAR